MNFSAQEIINVVGVEQRYPQQVVAQLIKELGFIKEADGFKHLSYERVSLPETDFSGRAGTWLGFTADELLAEGKNRVKEKLKPDLNHEEKEEIQRVVALGAIKFSFLHPANDKRIIFKWDDSLNMQGDSGPYLQYAYVRTLGIMKKAQEKGEKLKVVKGYYFSNEEKRLLKMLCEFPQIVEKSSKDLSPHQIAMYLLNVAGMFNKFYDTSRVLNAEKEEERKTRLAIVGSTNTVLKNGLALLGISCPEKM